MTEQKIVADPERDRVAGVTTDGVGVSTAEFPDGELVTISNFSGGSANETVYLDPADVPALQQALSEVLLER